MIDREKVIKGVHDVRRYLEDREWVDKSVGVYIDALNDTIAMLKEHEAVEPKWTSIKERYPDKEGFYLVSADHGNYLPWIAEMKILCGVKGFCNGAAMPCVGAWMPLPEPYNRTDLKATITQEGR